MSLGTKDSIYKNTDWPGAARGILVLGMKTAKERWLDRNLSTHQFVYERVSKIQIAAHLPLAPGWTRINRYVERT